MTDEALCVCELADILEMPQSSVSSHVQVIRRAGLLEGERCGKWTYFRIDRTRLGLLRTLDEAFPEKGRTSDAARALRRLKEREGSCCPGPQKLATRPGAAKP